MLPASIMETGIAIPGGVDIDAQDGEFAGLMYPHPVKEAGSNQWSQLH